jgi:hypothetical protein
MSVLSRWRLRNTPFVESSFERRNERWRVLREKELAVGHHAAGIIDKGDQLGLSGGLAVFQERADHGVELPHFVGELFADSPAVVAGRRECRRKCNAESLAGWWRS